VRTSPSWRRTDRLRHDERAERVPRRRDDPGWDITQRLGEIDVPTCVSGGHDEATPRIVGDIRDGIPNAEWVLFEESSHLPHVEEPERFSRRSRVLAAVEAR